MTTKRLIKPVHPGRILLQEFLEPMGITQYRLAKDINVPPRRINEIVQEKRGVTVDTALRLALFFGTSSAFWLGLQIDYDLDMAKLTVEKKIQKEVHPWHGQLVSRTA